MEFTTHKAETLVLTHPWLDDNLTRCERCDGRQWAEGQSSRLHNDELVAAVHTKTAARLDYARKAEGMPVLNDLNVDGRPIEYAEVAGGSLMAPEPRPYSSEREYQRLVRDEEKARKDLAAFQANSKPAAGKMSWGEVVIGAKALVNALAMKGEDIRPYTFKGRPSRKAMLEAAALAEAGHAKRKAIAESKPDYETAKAIVLGIVREEESPLRLVILDHAMSRTLNAPIVDVTWGPGRVDALPEDLARMFNFIAGEAIKNDLLDQLDRRYASYKASGILTLTAAERRRQLAAVDAEIHAAELEEAGHMWGVMEADGVLLLPRANMGVRAILGIA